MDTDTLARGLLMLGTDTTAVDTDTGMADHTMVDTTDTVMDTDTDTTVKKTVLECNILPFFKQPPFGAFETYTTALCNITENCVFFYEKIVTKLIIGPIVIKNSQKMPLFFKKGTCATSSVLLSGYDIQLLSEIVILSEKTKQKPNQNQTTPNKT